MKGEKEMKQQICIGLVLFATLVVLGMTPSLAQGSQNNEDGALISANTTSPASAPWFVNTVDSSNDVGQYVSVALDPASGTSYVSYYDATYKDLRMAKSVSSGRNCGPNNDWACETVDSAGDVGKYSSIAVDPTDKLPIIAYYDASNGALKLAIGSGVGWIIKTIDDPLIGSAGSYASLKLDSTGKTRIAYYFSNLVGVDSLWYAKYVGGGAGNCGGNDYQCDLIDSGDQVGKYASLALDSSDRPRIAYYDGGNDALMYAYQNGSWTIREILPIHSGQYASLYVDVNNGNLPHIAHYDSSNGKLGYAVYVGSNGNCGFDSSSTDFLWQCDEIDSIGSTTPVGVSLAVDKAGYPIIAYQDTVGLDSLNIARPDAALGLQGGGGNCGPNPSLFYTWYCETLTPLGPYYDINYSPGDYIAIDVNPAGLATIAFYGGRLNGDGSLKVAYQRLQVFLPLALRQSP
jgi:hypothetical protein